MIEPFLKWYRIFAKAPGYKWARIWAVIATCFILWFAWCWRAGELGLALVLVVPTWIALASFWECLADAFNQSLVINRLLLLAEPEPVDGIELENEVLAGDYYTPGLAEERAAGLEYEEEQEENSRLAQQQVQAATEADSPNNNGYSLADERRLALCQFYVFLYLVVKLHLTGENTLSRLVGMPARKYRHWVKFLTEEMGFITSSQGKVTVLDGLTFEEALKQIAAYKQRPTMWDFPIKVYNSPANWRKYDPANRVEVNGRQVSINAKRGGRRNAAPPLLPLYPQQLQELVFEADF